MGSPLFKYRLNELIESNGKTRKKVAEDLKIPYTTFCNYFADTMPKLDTFIRIAVYFGVSLDYLAGLDNDKL